MKKVKFLTLGCKVNQYETQGIRERFSDNGFQEQENNCQHADVYIVNTCTVTAQADAQSRRLIRQALRFNPHAKIITTGCYAQSNPAEILRVSQRIQIVPNQQKHHIVNLVNSSDSYKTNREQAFLPLKISNFKDHQRAFVKIQDGCNNLCAFCKVALVRGRSRSRRFKEIGEEASRLVAFGFKEIVLTGICLGDYHYRDYGLVDVLATLEKIKGQFRLRLSSIEPQLISNALIAKIASSSKICAHLHIPLQSGDNTILRKMNRRYTAEDYLGLVAKVKKKVKDVAISTDILVGFPGETDKNFRNTIKCLKEVLPVRTHTFSFSPREGTAAFNLQRRIEPRLIKERIDLLRGVAAESSYKFRRQFLGKQLQVLIESEPDKESGAFCGYSENYIRVMVTNASKENINNLVEVKIEDVNIRSTKGTRVRQRIRDGKR